MHHIYESVSTVLDQLLSLDSSKRDTLTSTYSDQDQLWGVPPAGFHVWDASKSGWDASNFLEQFDPFHWIEHQVVKFK